MLQLKPIQVQNRDVEVSFKKKREKNKMDINQ